MAADPLSAALEDMDSRHYPVAGTGTGDRVCESDRHKWPCHAHRALAALTFLLGRHPVISRDEYDRLAAILSGEEKTGG